MRFLGICMTLLFCLVCTVSFADDAELKKLQKAPDLDKPHHKSEKNFTDESHGKGGHKKYKTKDDRDFTVTQIETKPNICRKLKELLEPRGLTPAKLTGVTVKTVPGRPNIRRVKGKAVFEFPNRFGAFVDFEFAGATGVAPKVDIKIETSITNFGCQVEGVPLSKAGAVQLIDPDNTLYKKVKGKGSKNQSAKGKLYVSRTRNVLFFEDEFKKGIIKKVGAFEGTRRIICEFYVKYVVKVNNCPVATNFVRRSFSTSITGTVPITIEGTRKKTKYTCGIPTAGGIIGKDAFVDEKKKKKNDKIGYRSGVFDPSSGFDGFSREKSYRVAVQTPEVCVGTTYTITDTTLREELQAPQVPGETVVVVEDTPVVTEQGEETGGGTIGPELVTIVTGIPEFVTLDPFEGPVVVSDPQEVVTGDGEDPEDEPVNGETPPVVTTETPTNGEGVPVTVETPVVVTENGVPTGTPGEPTGTPEGDPVTTPPEKTDTPYLGIVKAGAEVVELVLTDGQTGSPVGDVVVRNLEPVPALPGEGPTVDLASSDFDAGSFFESDVDGGVSDETGAVQLASLTFPISNTPNGGTEEIGTRTEKDLKKEEARLRKEFAETAKEIQKLRQGVTLSKEQQAQAKKLFEDAAAAKRKMADMIGRHEESARRISDVRKDKDMKDVDKKFADAADKLVGDQKFSCCTKLYLRDAVYKLMRKAEKRIDREASKKFVEIIDKELQKDKAKGKKLSELKKALDKIIDGFRKNRRAQKRLAEDKKKAEERKKAEGRKKGPGRIDASNEPGDNGVPFASIGEIDLASGRGTDGPGILVSHDFSSLELAELVAMSIAISAQPPADDVVKQELLDNNPALGSDILALELERDAIIGRLGDTLSGNELDEEVNSVQEDYSFKIEGLFSLFALVNGEREYSRLSASRIQADRDLEKRDAIGNSLLERFGPAEIQSAVTGLNGTVPQLNGLFPAVPNTGGPFINGHPGLSPILQNFHAIAENQADPTTSSQFNLAIDTGPVDQTILALGGGTLEEALVFAALNPVIGEALVNAFTIGSQPVLIAATSGEQTEALHTFAEESTTISWFEPNHCRKKQETDDPYFDTSGLWNPEIANQWAVKRAGLSADILKALKDSKDPATVTIAVIDTGIDWTHPDLDAGALWENTGEIPSNGIDDDENGYVDDRIGWDFIEQSNKPWDHDGHGTFVAGVIAAANDNGFGIAGMNPNARIMVLKALDTFGQGYASMVSEAVTYAADNGAQIINMSLGSRKISRLEGIAIQYARSKGVLVIVAAGNDAVDVAGFGPAGLEGVITVSATDLEDRRAGFSNWGEEIDIAAPGVDVLSLRARNTDLLSYIRGVDYDIGAAVVGEPRAFFRASGTSFAAPIVTGAASVVMSLNPDYSAEQVRNAILNSATDIESPGLDNFSGYGLLNLQGALEADPDFNVESRITGVEVVRVNGKTALRVLGTTNADDFVDASISLGKGKQPDKWLRVRQRIQKPVIGGALMDLPAGAFRGTKEWTIRLITRHKNGAEREARFSLILG